MIYYLVVSGLVSLVFGILFIVAPNKFWERMGSLVNKPVLMVERELRNYHFPAGFLFLTLGTWLSFLVIGDPALWYFHFLGVLFGVVGLFYIFTPDWLLWISNLSGKVVITFDEIAIASRVSLGIVLVMVSIYIFLTLFAVLHTLY